MAYIPPVHIDDLLFQASIQGLYAQLIQQINKDFAMGNEPVDLPASTTPREAVMQVEEKILRLLTFHFEGLLNLLYIIDIPEKTVQSLDGSDREKLASELTFLILRRQWQKVWYRANF